MAGELVYWDGSNVTSVGAGSVPEVYRKEALLYRFAKAIGIKRVLNADAEVKAFGDIVNVRTLPALTVGDVTAASGALADVTDANDYYANAQITVNKWKYVAASIVDKAETQSMANLMMDFSRQMGEAIGENQDTYLFSLYASLTTNTVGDSTTGDTFTDGIILPAMQKLDDAKVPQGDRSWFVPPVAKTNLLTIDKFVWAYATGMQKGPQVVGMSALGELYGIPLYVTPLIATSGSIRKAMLLHKEAYGVATQKNFKMETFARTAFATKMAGSVLYGAAVVRENHGCLLNVKAS